jgi:hypothetical protein
LGVSATSGSSATFITSSQTSPAIDWSSVKSRNAELSTTVDENTPSRVAAVSICQR